MSATRIMIIRHAERPGTYDGTQYFGVNPTGGHRRQKRKQTPDRDRLAARRSSGDAVRSALGTQTRARHAGLSFCIQPGERQQ